MFSLSNQTDIEQTLEQYFWQLVLNNCYCLNNSGSFNCMTAVEASNKIEAYIKTRELWLPKSHFTKRDSEDFYNFIINSDIKDYPNSKGRSDFTSHASWYILNPSVPVWQNSMKRLRKQFDIKEHYAVIELCGDLLYKDENIDLLFQFMVFGLITAIHKGGGVLDWFIAQIIDGYPPYQVMQCSALTNIADIPWIKILAHPEQYLSPVRTNKKNRVIYQQKVKGFAK